MPAARAVLVGGADGSEAVSAAGGELVIALGAEMKVALHMGSAGGAAGDQWRAEKEIEYGADSAGHDEADQHPEAGTHGPSGSVFAYVADHEEVERREQAPGDVEVDAQAKGRDVVLRLGEFEPEVVLHKDKHNRRDRDGPHRHELFIFVLVD